MASICFIDGQSNRQWVETLRQAADSLGKSFVQMDHAHLEIEIQDCELVILDAGAIGNDLGAIVRDIHASNPRVRIVVVTSAPHWKEARQILLAGATDYARKKSDLEGILDILRGNVTTLLNRGK